MYKVCSFQCNNIYSNILYTTVDHTVALGCIIYIYPLEKPCEKRKQCFKFKCT